MTDDPAKPAGKRNAASAPRRKARGFQRAAELTPTALKNAGARRGFAEFRLLTEWRAIVGDATAEACRPVKVSYASRSPSLGATLVIAVEGARAPEIEMQKPRIIERVNQFYGYRAVSRLRIDQGRTADADGFAEAAAPFAPPPEAPAKPVEGVADQRLALALGRLGANIRYKSQRQTARANRRPQ